MPLTVKRITLWRKEVENRPGVLAETLGPIAQAGADLRLVMGYRFPQDPARSAIELYPVAGKRQTTAAQQAGLELVQKARRTIPARSHQSLHPSGLMSRGFAAVPAAASQQSYSAFQKAGWMSGP